MSDITTLEPINHKIKETLGHHGKAKETLEILKHAYDMYRHDIEVLENPRHYYWYYGTRERLMHRIDIRSRAIRRLRSRYVHLVSNAVATL